MPELSHLTVLLVDASDGSRRTTRALLRQIGFHNVMESKTGADAFKLFCAAPVALIITEYATQPLDGISLARMVRNEADSPNPVVPILMLSEHTEAKIIMGARDWGINEFAAKPVSHDTLKARVLTILQSPCHFVRCTNYFGPDRRRKRRAQYNGPERRAATGGQAADKPLPVGAADFPEISDLLARPSA